MYLLRFRGALSAGRSSCTLSSHCREHGKGRTELRINFISRQFSAALVLVVIQQDFELVLVFLLEDVTDCEPPRATSMVLEPTIVITAGNNEPTPTIVSCVQT